MVADDPDKKIRLRAFHCEIVNDHGTLKREQSAYKALPVIAEINSKMVAENYFMIKQEVEELIETEIEVLLNTPGMD